MFSVEQIDRITSWVITFIGWLVILSVVGIFALSFQVALPLFLPASIEQVFEQNIETSKKVVAVGIGDYLENSFLLQNDGSLVLFEKGQRQKSQVKPPQEGLTILSAKFLSNHIYQVLWSNGTLSLEQIKFSPQFTEQGRLMSLKIENLATFPSMANTQIAVSGVFGEEEELKKIAVYVNIQHQIQILVQTEIESFLGDKTVEEKQADLEGIEGKQITALALGQEGEIIFAGTNSGQLFHWDISDAEEINFLGEIKTGSQSAVSAMEFATGEISLVVSYQDGKSEVYSVFTNDDGKQWTQIHQLPNIEQTYIQQLIPAPNNKSMFAKDNQGMIYLFHLTTEKEVIRFGNNFAFFTPSNRGNGGISFSKDQSLQIWKLDNPHPEISWKALFSEIWYEGYSKPEYVWQSSASNDDFEPKLSLIPLLLGTLKGAFYAIILAAPIAVFGAIYISQFAKPALRNVVKPVVEIMAAMPSVIVGLLAALWLAPLLESFLIGAVVGTLLSVFGIWIFLICWEKLSRQYHSLTKLEGGWEFILLLPVLVSCFYLANLLSPVVELLLFDGNFKQWLFAEWNTPYSQRNSIVAGFALGFMTIPIIFTISEDALSNVPTSLKAASYALGASRWQTAARITLPAAISGVFASIIIGLGRAIGETMVVLMTTGNTPVTSWSIFTGMRTFSANIAVELPEAPVDSTLYRTLFLSAILLFLITFILNSVADYVRQHFSKRYGDMK